MAKRFTDTDKFIDPWYRRLSTKNKLLWDWLLCNCDHAGLITVDFEFIEMVLNETFADDVLAVCFVDRVIPIGPGKYFIPKFLKFQYGKLNPNSRIHASVIERLRDAGVIYNDGDSVKEIENNARVIGFVNPLDRVKDKEQAKDKDKEQDKDIRAEKNLPEIKPQDFRNPKDFVLAGLKSPDDLITYWNEKLAPKGFPFAPLTLGGTNQDKFFQINSQLRQQGLSWLDYVRKVEESDFLTRRKRGGPPSITWLLKDLNFDDVMAGKYDENMSEEEEIKLLKSVGLA